MFFVCAVLGSRVLWVPGARGDTRLVMLWARPKESRLCRCDSPPVPGSTRCTLNWKRPCPPSGPVVVRCTFQPVRPSSRGARRSRVHIIPQGRKEGRWKCTKRPWNETLSRMTPLSYHKGNNSLSVSLQHPQASRECSRSPFVYCRGMSGFSGTAHQFS